MPGNSPVVISSSSPAVFRLPSETPQPEKQKTTAEESSSPGLPSPSTFFVRPAAPSQQAGSRAQQVPEGANGGFASAASLLRSNYFGSEAGGGERAVESARKERTKKISDNGDSVPEKSTGKLPRPKKAAKETPMRRERSRSITPLQEFLYRDASPRHELAARHPLLQSPSLPQAPLDTTEQRRRSISLSAYDFNPGQDDAPKDALPLPKLPKKPRKTSAKGSGEGDAKPGKKRVTKRNEAGDAVPKKPRKKLEKSASIILNSDDLASTQFRFLDAETIGAGKRTDPVNDETKPKRAPVVKTKKPPKEPKAAKAKPASKRSTDADAMHAQSAYFGQPPPIDREATDLPSLDTFKHGATDYSVNNPPTPVQAGRRRLSWTPAKDTTATVLERPTTASSTISNDEQPTLSLAAVLGNLGYARQDTGASSQRSVSGEALTKRRRIELADEATRAPVAPRPAEPAPAEPKKKDKAPKKKPQTITALATKAYEMVEESVPNAGQASVSTFFSPQKIDTAPARPVEDVPSEKVKKLRKSRAKKVDGDAATTKAVKVTKPPKAAKTKVKFKEADYLPPLYTPSQARLEEKRQDFLFGTSSQLAVEESPTFIRQMQLAVRESEMSVSQLEASPIKKSCIRVSSGPHGSDLALGQGYKEHWCSAARDEDDELLYAAYQRRVSPLKRNMPPPEPVDVPRKDERPAVDKLYAAPAAPLRPSPTKDLTPPPEPTADFDHEIVDLCQTSPMRGIEDECTTVPNVEGTALDQLEAPAALHAPSDGEWLMLESDEVAPDLNGDMPAPVSVAKPLFKAAVPTLKRSATSPIQRRSALQALDGNTHLLAQTSPQKAPISSQQRAFTTDAPAQQPMRPRGRPKKDALANETASPKKRGRPPIQKGATTIPPFKPTISASQPDFSDYADIDDIVDDPIAHVTPSPPRRRANSTPPTVKPLDFAAPTSPSKKSKASATAQSKLKPDDPKWLEVVTGVYAKITATVRSTPPSSDMVNPTWHEKILLYDPIVLEDLTAWLTDQGVGIEMQKLKVKPKAKGRKKKDADAEAVEEQPEYETVTEELKPWMVQKWCEEKSICCLWKEGLRGGVRTRY